jgi:hypothetical protein
MSAATACSAVAARDRAAPICKSSGGCCSTLFSMRSWRTGSRCLTKPTQNACSVAALAARASASTRLQTVWMLLVKLFSGRLRGDHTAHEVEARWLWMFTASADTAAPLRLLTARMSCCVSFAIMLTLSAALLYSMVAACPPINCAC